ncbi:hypothetical protein BG257_16600 [Proteus mirabilis]|uniref:Uncharacterized protein n=4 Tax=Proteus mirabilis TaxID=584 RepID=A0AAJ4RKY3_PROMI|nr:hypothetical protein AOC00_06940 [Proteus mirabilis]ALE25137.1 hypothetical protein AOB99_06965 [Proteus mirabilis]ARX35150.1 hypothetical protein AM402_13640 [Proteus mirabilis]ASB03479.1 hypothetical protein AM403_18095 [Proteus mirabilis]ATC76147.1 hypothetical protein BG257_16600 [Proteus mirabilis]
MLFINRRNQVRYILLLFISLFFIVIFLLKTQGSTKNDVINQPTEIERKLNKKVERCMFHSKIKTKRLPWIMLTRKRSCS